jgi:transcriptional regulator with XRE-family HTH domain
MNSSHDSFNLRALRKKAGLTQRELGAILGKHYSNIGFWETNGKMPPAELLPAMAKALGISIEEIFGLKKKDLSVSFGGKARLTFEAVAQLPKKRQERILEVINALLEHR